MIWLWDLSILWHTPCLELVFPANGINIRYLSKNTRKVCISTEYLQITSKLLLVYLWKSILILGWCHSENNIIVKFIQIFSPSDLFLVCTHRNILCKILCNPITPISIMFFIAMITVHRLLLYCIDMKLPRCYFIILLTKLVSLCTTKV